MDGVFAAFPAPAGLTAPDGAEVVYLRAALFVLQGRYFDPGTGKERPLPPHRFALVASGVDVISEGTVSDADGISTIFDVDRTGVSDDARWELVLIPVEDEVCGDGGLAQSYAKHRELWIDVEKKVWVKSGFDDDTQGLLRIPLWSTRIKAERGGGFVAAYDHDPGFVRTGTITQRELAPQGTRDHPWVLQIDHGWLRTWVQFHAFDPTLEVPLDRALGAVVRLESSIGGAGAKEVVGASTVLTKDGSIGIVHAGTPETLADLEYGYQTWESWVSFADGSRCLRGGDETANGATHYSLPSTWVSRGAEAWIGPDRANDDNRRSFAELRHRGTKAEAPLCFHLDDLWICDSLHTPVAALPDDRICVLDQWLAIRDQASKHGKWLPYSKLRPTSPRLRAESFVFVRKRGHEQTTRVIEVGGRIFMVGNDRVLLSHDCAGQRAATPAYPAPPSADAPGRHETYFVDASSSMTEFGDVSGPLYHVLVYLPCHVRLDGTPPGDPAAIVAAAESSLMDAAVRWDQWHTGHANAAKKHYALVPSNAKECAPIVRIRHHFGALSSALRWKLVHAPVTHQPSAAFEILLKAMRGRAFCSEARVQLYLEHGTQEAPLGADDAAPWAFEANATGGQTDPFDGSSGTSFTLAHELGHALGLGDEYQEPVIIDDKPRRLPSFGYDGTNGRSHGYLAGEIRRPFAFDGISMMNGAYLPRLRHQVGRASELVGIFGSLPATHPLRTYQRIELCAHRKGAPSRFGLDHVPDFGAFEVGKANRVGCCWLRRYVLGDDESSRGAMIGLAAPLDKPFDELALINCRMRFAFAPGKDLALVCDEIYDRFAAHFVAVHRAPKLCVKGSVGTLKRKILVLVQPVFAVCRLEAPLSVQSHGAPITIDPAKDVADIVVEVVDQKVVPRPQGDVFTPSILPKRPWLPPAPLAIRLGLADLGPALMRFALWPSRGFPAENQKPFAADDAKLLFEHFPELKTPSIEVLT